MAESYSSKQLRGSEYGGVADTPSTLQPIPESALDNGERLRLGYLTGEMNTESFVDRRQFWGLRPAGGERPRWLSETGVTSQADIEGVGERE